MKAIIILACWDKDGGADFSTVVDFIRKHAGNQPYGYINAVERDEMVYLVWAEDWISAEEADPALDMALASIFTGRPQSSELFQYPPTSRDIDDVILCPRCQGQDMFPGQRVCTTCLAEINADDFS